MCDSVSSENQGLHSGRTEVIQESRKRGFLLKANFSIRKDQKTITISLKDIFRYKFVGKEENYQTFQGQPRTMK